jgi:hypothetical protein
LVEADANGAADANDSDDANDADRESPTATIRGFESLLASARNVPPAVLAAVDEVR